MVSEPPDYTGGLTQEIVLLKFLKLSKPSFLSYVACDKIYDDVMGYKM